MVVFYVSLDLYSRSAVASLGGFLLRLIFGNVTMEMADYKK